MEGRVSDVAVAVWYSTQYPSSLKPPYCISILLLSQELRQYRPISLTFLPIQSTVVKLLLLLLHVNCEWLPVGEMWQHGCVHWIHVLSLQFGFHIKVINGWRRQQEYFHSVPGIGILAQMKDSERLGSASSWSFRHCLPTFSYFLAHLWGGREKRALGSLIPTDHPG